MALLPTAPAPPADVRRIFEDYLERKGHRRTQERFAILNEVYAQEGHFDIDRLYGHMLRKNYRVSRATLYNTMELLLDSRLVRRHRFGGPEAQYERAHARGQHDHLICDGCGRVMEFCDPRIQHIRTSVAASMRFDVRSHTLHLHGLCEHCKAKPART